jgi:hypothetical protein
MGTVAALQHAGFQGWLCGTKRKLEHNALRTFPNIIHNI